MGKRSTKENKSIYQISREEAGMTREEAGEAIGFVSDSRIEKFESGKSPVRPEEVLAMAKAYKKPALCNYYCSHECPIGQEFVPEVRVKDLAQIVLQMLATMNSLEKARDRLIEITADGEISDEELNDFARIEKGISEIGIAADSLELWVNNMIASGKINEKKLDEARSRIRQQDLPAGDPTAERYFAKREK
ncbi:MAG: helix-turn-helix domain-containing protein [Anaerovoracaceae bacterium]